MEKNDVTKLVCLNSQGLRMPHCHTCFATTHLYPHQGTSPDIIYLQETHSRQQIEADFLQSFQLACYFLHPHDIKGGLLTGFRHTLDYCLHNQHPVELETEGPRPQIPQALLTHCTVKQIEMVIVNMYIPPETPEKDRADFLSKLEKEWQQFGCSNIICWKRQLQEKSSKYFFRKYNAVPGSSHMLYDNKGNLCNTDAGILQVCHNFYPLPSGLTDRGHPLCLPACLGGRTASLPRTGR